LFASFEASRLDAENVDANLLQATGNFKDKVEKGFKMHLQVKYGLITLINQEADGCDTIGKADLECPLDKGEMTLSKDVDLPREIPPVRTSQSRDSIP
jgi:hypothetical protein